MGKKKTEKIGTIKGLDLVKKTKGIQSIPFKSGYYMTDRDRPRKKVTPKNMDEYM